MLGSAEAIIITVWRWASLEAFSHLFLGRIQKSLKDKIQLIKWTIVDCSKKS